MKLRGEKGFALIEAIVVMALIAILANIALPYYQVFMRNASYRSAARSIATAMRQARAEAVTRNREHRVEIDLDNDTLTIKQGNRARQSSAWPATISRETMSSLVDLVAGVPATPGDCSDASGIETITFRPDGTADGTIAICTLNQSGERKFRSQVLFPTTGQVEVIR